MQPLSFFRRRRAEIDDLAAAATELGTCPPHICAKGRDCVPFATSCDADDAGAACHSDACCVVLDLDVIDSNIAGHALPEASIQRCGDSSHVYCSSAGKAGGGPGVCARTVPDWSDF